MKPAALLSRKPIRGSVPRRSPIVKILAWRNPGPFGGMEPRWDLEIVREDETRERIVDVAAEHIKRLLELTERVARKAEE